MTGIKLYGFPRSTCTKRVATILKEKNLPYELIPISLAEKANTTPEYLEKHPFGQVPVLDDNGYHIYESRAIGRYIALKYASQGIQDLIPDSSDLEAIGRFEEACSLEHSQFNPSAEGLGQELLFKKLRGEETDPAAVAKLTATLEKKLDAYEKILSKRKYLAGDHVTLADLYHLSYAELVISVLKIDILSTRPNLARWWNDISTRESWQVVKNGA